MTIIETKGAAWLKAAFVAASLASLPCAACVKDDPIVTGNRDAAAAPPARTAIVPQADPPDVDGPGCKTCGETLETSSERGTLCRKNKPRSSAVLLNELVGCVCQDACVAECASYCSGAPLEKSCLPCIVAGCGALLGECSSDLPAK